MAAIVTSRRRNLRFRAPDRPWRLNLDGPFCEGLQSAFVVGAGFGVALGANQSATASNSANIAFTSTPAGWGARRVNANNISGELLPVAQSLESGWNGESTLLIAGWRNGVTGSNNRTVLTLRDASGPLYQWKDSNGTMSASTYYNTSASFTTTGATDTDTALKNQFISLAFRSRKNGANYDQSVWLNGAQDANVSRTQGLRSFSSSVGGTHTWSLPDNTGGNVFGSDIVEISGAALFRGALPNEILERAYYEPWFWLAPEAPFVISLPPAGGASSAVGSAAGTSTSSAVGQSTAESDGVAAGTSTALAVGQSAAASAGSAAGTSTALAVGSSTSASSGVGSAAGTSTALAVGQSTAESVGAAAGSSTALGISAGSAESVAAGGASSRARRRSRYRRRVLIDGKLVVVRSPQELEELLREYDAQLRARLERAEERKEPTKAIKRRIKIVERRIEKVEQEIVDWRAQRRKRDEEVLVLWSLIS